MARLVTSVGTALGAWAGATLADSAALAEPADIVVLLRLVPAAGVLTLLLAFVSSQAREEQSLPGLLAVCGYAAAGLLATVLTYEPTLPTTALPAFVCWLVAGAAGTLFARGAVGSMMAGVNRRRA